MSGNFDGFHIIRMSEGMGCDGSDVFGNGNIGAKTEIIKKNAQKTSTEIHINFAMKFINKISKDVFPENIQKNMLFEKMTNDYSNNVMFKRFYLEDLRTKCRAMKFQDLFKNPEMLKDYLTLKPKYQLLK